jgi:hypothetical protein
VFGTTGHVGQRAFDARQMVSARRGTISVEPRLSARDKHRRHCRPGPISVTRAAPPRAWRTIRRPDMLLGRTQGSRRVARARRSLSTISRPGCDPFSMRRWSRFVTPSTCAAIACPVQRLGEPDEPGRAATGLALALGVSPIPARRGRTQRLEPSRPCAPGTSFIELKAVTAPLASRPARTRLSRTLSASSRRLRGS